LFVFIGFYEKINKEGFEVGRNKVIRMMNKLGLVVKQCINTKLR
tara:strand:- start:3252 stop:3383 length:132 start_codon:yes stop_codon:yes gene_type:complete